MPYDRTNAVVGEPFTLSVAFTRNSVAYEPYEIVRVEIIDVDLAVVETISLIEDNGGGVYQVSVSALEEAATYSDRWFYRISEDGALLSRSGGGVVVHPVEVADAEEPEVPAPDAGAGSVCVLTATFYDGSGAYRRGVRVDFYPDPVQTGEPAVAGVSYDPVAAESDARGAVRLQLVRGLRGQLTVHGMHGYSRRVEVPDEDEADLLGLLGDVDSPLALRSPPPRYVLPRTT